MSQRQHDALEQLMTGDEWQAVDLAATTLRAMVNADWVQEADGPGGMVYRITRRGRDAYALFAPPTAPYRKDGLCPRCGDRPRGEHGYCKECARKKGCENYARNGQRRRREAVGRLCATCGKRPVRVTASGYAKSYCLDCDRRRNREQKRRSTADLLARVNAGEHVACTTCGAPVYATDKWITCYCKDCYNTRQLRAKARRAWRKAVRRA